jgi:hydroxysqualene synthase
MRAVAIDHYENFPVASWLCPPALRPDVVAIYRFARTADDIADEGSAIAAERLADLAAYRADLGAVADGREPSKRWRHIFLPLRGTLAVRRLPLELLENLLSAFEQDARETRYASRAELLEYCRLSANPVGRLMLHLYAVDDVMALAESDAVCTSLQLINFWQDLGVDLRRGRYYVPHADCKRHGLEAPWEWAATDTTRTRGLTCELAAWARTLMMQGAPLVHRLAGRSAWELRLVVQGGLRILDKIEQLGGATIATRPVLRGSDAPRLLWRALRMKQPPRTAAATIR